MSEDAPESAAGDTPKAKSPRKRPARRVAKPAAPPAAGQEEISPAPESPAPAPAEPSTAPAPAAHVPAESSSDAPDDGPPEPIAVIVEPPSAELPSSSKKRRRKKKKHGQQAHPHQPSPSTEDAEEGSPTASEPHAPAMHAAPRPKLDASHVAKKAWKIFLAEVSEEGLALINDHDAREISRRSFRLAEIFLEEEARRTR